MKMIRAPFALHTALAVLAFASVLAQRADADFANPGPHQPGFRTVTVARQPGLGSGTFTALLYYPATSVGSNAPFDASAAPYPVVSFGHGFFQATTQYDNLLAHLATHGYFVIASNSEGGLFPSHQNFANDIRSCLGFMESENAAPASPYFQRVNTSALGLSGHSMGGGASMLAAAVDARVRALIPLAPADTNPSSIAAAPQIDIPTMYIVGTQDTIVPTGPNAQVMYDNTPAPRRLEQVIGGFHCGFTDASTFGCDSGAVTREAQQVFVKRLMAEFFALTLKGDQSTWRRSWGPESASVTGLTRAGSPRASLTPAAQSITAPANTPAAATLTLTNDGTVPVPFTLLSEDATWPITPSPLTTPLLAPGASTGVSFTVTAPPGPASSQTALVSARNTLDNSTRAYASITFNRPPPPPGGCPADLDNNAQINVADLTLFLGLFGTPVTPPGGPGDINADGQVNVADLTLFLGVFGTPCAA
ncbi:MAG: chlorophyllase/cutinase-like alpha/beta fold protein [Phycisphaerales bacterium]